MLEKISKLRVMLRMLSWFGYESFCWLIFQLQAIRAPNADIRKQIHKHLNAIEKNQKKTLPSA